MSWRLLSGKNTLLRISPSGAQKVIGKDDSDGRLMYERFMARKTQAESRVRSLRGVVMEQQRMNRACASYACLRLWSSC